MTSALYEDDTTDIQEKELKPREAFRKLLPFLYRHWKKLAVCLVLLVVVTGLSLLWPVLVKRGIDVSIAQQLDVPVELRDYTDLIVLGLSIVLIQLAIIVLQYLQYVKLEIVGQDIMLELKQKLFNHILSLDISFFDRNPVGRVMARIESDTESLRLLFTNTAVLVVGDLLLMIGLYSVMFYHEWQLALVLLLFAPVLAGLIYVFHRLTTHRFIEVRKRMAEVTASLTELIQGMSIIQIFHRGQYARRKAYRASEAKFSEDSYVNIAICIFFNVVFFLEYVKIGLVLLMGGVLGLSAGTIVLFILLIWKEFDPIYRVADQLGNFQKGIAGATRIFTLMNVRPKLFEPLRPVAWSGLHRGIRFEDVWFSYTDNDDWVLKGVSFDIPVGKRVALAGVTGGGKTTVISLLLRLYDPQRGRITVDGTDLRDIRTEELRRHFALVLQDIVLFPGDIAANIGLEADDISMDRIRQSAVTVAADPFIRELPRQYRTEVSEKGLNFSRGERQLLSFARALAVNPDVLILDEATSSVDPATERTIQNSLNKLMEGRTSLVIAHRLATILDADQILVLRHGEVVERGTHTELILKNGYYSKLFHLQFKNSLIEVNPNA
ncbi:MAG: ABC transporter ATP-binding protein [Candidatus Zixiibacteriota bacterium]|nr:MAG: ABC transporter ATP-binding protein [candidate division Zixibacteria bacterium]